VIAVFRAASSVGSTKLDKEPLYAHISVNLSAQEAANSSGTLSLSDAASRYGISAQTLRRLCDGKQIECERDSRGWRVHPREVENYVLARRPAGRQSVGLWLQGPAPNWRAKDGVGWRFKALLQGGRQVFIEIWLTNELVVLLQKDDYDVRDIVVRSAEQLVNDALLESDELQDGQEIWYGTADRAFLLKAAGLGDDSYLSSEAPSEIGTCVLYEFTIRDGLWPGDSIDSGTGEYVDVVVDIRVDGGAKRVRTVRVEPGAATGSRGEIIQKALFKYEARCRRLGVTLGLWVISVAARSRALTLSQQRVLELVWDSWHTTGEWPVFGYVEAKLDSEYDSALKDVVATFPQGLLWGISPYAQQADKVALTVAGLAHCQSAGADLDVFLQTVRYLVERRRRFTPSTPTQAENLKVTSEEVTSEFDRSGGVPSGAVSRMYDLLMQDPFIQHGGGKSIDGKWEVIVGPESRRYRGIETVDEYLVRRQPDANPWDQSASPGPRVAALTSLTQVIPQVILPDQPETDIAVEGTSYVCDVFVLMPFAPEFDDVWITIKDTSARLNLKCIRADTITLPGRITHQIVEAIRAATAIVADVTGNNPNVMFELGYADALGKPIVVLNQRLAEAPFDLKDWRQIVYSTNRLEAMQTTLAQFLDQVVMKSRAGSPLSEPMPEAPSERPILSIRGSNIPGSSTQAAEFIVKNVGTRAALDCRAAIRAPNASFFGQSIAVAPGEEMHLIAGGRGSSLPNALFPANETQAVFYVDPEGWLYRTTFQGQTDGWHHGPSRPDWVVAYEAVIEAN
jgi:hypothetical protein